MSSVNKVIIVGNLGRDPECRTFPSGDMVANVNIATTDKWKDKQTGELKEATEWHRVSFHGRLAEIADQYLRKGSQVYVEGSLRTRKWQDKDGKDCYTTEIRAERMQLLGQRRDGDGGNDRGGYDDGGGRGGYDGGGRQNDRDDRARGAGGGRGNDRGGYQEYRGDRGSRGGNDRSAGGQQRQGGGRGGDDRSAGGQQRQGGGGDRGGYDDRGGQQRGGGGQQQQQPPQRASSGFDDMDDDIPF